MDFTWLMIVGCVVGAVLLAVFIGAVAYLMVQSGERDPVSSARQGWIQRRSEKDDQGW